jgi:two-component system, LytTR family, response regulator
MNLSCLIIDDEPLAVDLLEDHIGKVPYLELSGKCYHPMEALSLLETVQPDLIFLDINMPDLNGMQLATMMPSHSRIIFTTAYAEYALESYERNALDYLLKPISFERFLKCVTKAREYFRTLDTKQERGELVKEETSTKIFLRSGKKMIQVDIGEVTYIEGMKDYAMLFVNGERIIVGKRLKELEEQLPPNFQRVHLSWFVNLDKIKRIEDNHIIIDNTRIPISGKYRDEFMRRVNRRML